MCCWKYLFGWSLRHNSCTIPHPNAALSRQLPCRAARVQAASAELSRLNATRAGVVQRVHSLEGQLGRLVDEEAALLQQRAEGG